jgi:hypothetical protein
MGAAKLHGFSIFCLNFTTVSHKLLLLKLGSASNLNLCLMAFSIMFLKVQGQTQQVTTTKTKTVSHTSSGIVTNNSKSVTMSLGSHAFSDVLPFDEPFIIKCTPGANDLITFDQVKGIDCWYDVKKNLDIQLVSDNPAAYLKNHITGDIDPANRQFTISVSPLLPSKGFIFVFKVRRKLTPQQTTDLGNTINPLITQAVNEAANEAARRCSFEFSNAAFDSILSKVELQAANILNQQGLNVVYQDLDADHRKILLKSLQDICIAYQTSCTDKKTLDEKVSQLKILDENLKSFEVKYEGQVTDPVHNTTIIALKKVFFLFPPVYDYPKGSNTLDDSQKNAYTTDCKTLLDTLSPILPSDTALMRIKKDINGFINGISEKFKMYVSDRKDDEKTASNASKNFIIALSDQLYSMSYVSGTSTVADFVTRSNLYISADLGLAVIPDIGQMLPYLGTNIYLRPINKAYHLSFTKLDFNKRFSFLIGLSVTTLAKSGYRADLLGTNFNLLTGAGVRIADFVKINSGVIWYGQVNPNPLSTKKSIVSSWFISLSFDINVKTVFNNLFTSTQITSIQ